MSELDVIKSYLVSLGFQIDQPGLDKWKRELAKIDQMAKDMPLPWLRAAATIASALGTVTLATAGLLDSLAQADLGYKKFALRMYMTEDAAKRMKIATDALGESLDDIAWIPELRGRYAALVNQASKMEPGGDFAAQMRHIRDIRFEFTRLRVEMTYGAQWIGSYLYKYLNKEIGDFDNWLKRINDYLTENMPRWTEQVAKFLQGIVQLGGSGKRAIEDVLDVIGKIWDRLNTNVKTGIVAGGLLWLFTRMGPFGKAVTLLTSLVLLVDDFYAYIDGRKSSKTLAPIWDQLLGYTRMLSKAFGGLWEAFGHATRGNFAEAGRVLKETWNEFKEGGENVQASKGEQEFVKHKRKLFLIENWNKWREGAGFGYFTPLSEENLEKLAELHPEEVKEAERRASEEYRMRNGIFQRENEAHKQSFRKGKSSGSSAATSERAQKAISYLVDKGIKPEQAAGAVGSMMGESGTGLDPAALERKRGGGGFGIAQWTGKRRRALEEFARARGKSADDFDTQLDFMWFELQTSESKTLDALKNTSSAKEAAMVWTNQFERPNQLVARHGQRMKYAEQAYQTYQAGSNVPYTMPTMFGGSPGKIDASTTINGGINIDARDTGGDPEKISSRVIEKLEEHNKLAEARALRESQPVFS